MTMKQRKEAVYAKALSVSLYGIVFYLGQSEAVKDSFTALLMRGNRAIYGGPLPYDTKTKWICNMIGVKNRERK